VLVFEELAAYHDLTRFRSGNSQLDDYLRQEARVRHQRREARVLVLIDTEKEDIRPVGYIALAATGYYVPTFDPADTDLKHESFQYTALLAFLARDRATRGQGIGRVLLLEALRQCVLAGEHIGLPGIFLETTAAGIPLYQSAGFLWLDKEDGFMYLPMAKARAILESTGSI
jgi:GNAT superfamily N-acetyltransferase